jgi:hypothetical protein
MAFKVKASRYVEVCKKALARPTRYENSFPKNCGYYDGTYLWGDCWCFNPKTIIWGEALGTPVCDNYKKGTWIAPAAGAAASGMPDATGDQIMSRYCTPVTFKKMLQDKKAPALLLITGRHMGAYIGEFVMNGKTYNVCEYTSNGNLGNGLCPSYVDENGARKTHKNGTTLEYWSKAGYLTTFVDYTDAPTGTDTGSVGTLREEAQYMIDHGVNGQARINKAKADGFKPEDVQAQIDLMLGKDTAANISVLASAMPEVKLGSTGDVVVILQKELQRMGYYNSAVDGSAGNITVAAIKALQTNWKKVYGNMSVDGIFGPKCWSKLLK